MTMSSAHARYFSEISALLGGEFPKVHYLNSRAFDMFLHECRQYVKEAGQDFVGTDDTFYFRGVCIIRTGEP